jgi:hypothetical protein
MCGSNRRRGSIEMRFSGRHGELAPSGSKSETAIEFTMIAPMRGSTGE